MRRIAQLSFICLLLLFSAALANDKGLTVKGVRFFSYTAFTRVVFEIETAAPYVLTKTADGRAVRFSVYEGSLTLPSALPAIHDSVISGIEQREEGGKLFLVIRLEAGAGDIKDFVLRGPDRIVLDVSKGAPPAPVPPSGKPAVIVLDAGHGGRDTGIVTARGQEKSFTADLAVSVRKILQKDQRFKVILTRDRDSTLSLDERAAAANSAGAALFVSIHAAPGTAHAVLIYNSEDQPAAQPSLQSGRDFLGFETESEQQEKIWGRQQAVHAKESAALGRTLVRRLSANGNAEPMQAPLAGLKAIDCPAAVVEVGIESDRAKAVDNLAGAIEQYAGQNR